MPPFIESGNNRDPRLTPVHGGKVLDPIFLRSLGAPLTIIDQLANVIPAAPGIVAGDFLVIWSGRPTTGTIIAGGLWTTSAIGFGHLWHKTATATAADDAITTPGFNGPGLYRMMCFGKKSGTFSFVTPPNIGVGGTTSMSMLINSGDTGLADTLSLSLLCGNFTHSSPFPAAPAIASGQAPAGFKTVFENVGTFDQSGTQRVYYYLTAYSKFENPSVSDAAYTINVTPAPFAIGGSGTDFRLRLI